jgi:hypothetical protein
MQAAAARDPEYNDLYNELKEGEVLVLASEAYVIRLDKEAWERVVAHSNGDQEEAIKYLMEEDRRGPAEKLARFYVCCDITEKS